MPLETTMGGAAGAFESTLWTLVLNARDRSGDAVERLVHVYWKPVYFYIRRWGSPVEDAKDLTQGFFTQFLERDFLKDVSQEKGRFRTFLLTTLRHYLINEVERARAQKRGGGKPPLSLDYAAAETDYSRTPAAKTDLDGYFKRQWALTVLAHALEALGRELPPERFQALRRHLSPGPSPTYEATAHELGVTAEELKAILHRARNRYRRLIREEVRSSVDKESDVDDEIRELFAAL